MATGQEHYKTAERLLDLVQLDNQGIVYNEASFGELAVLAAAQTHATLALAAATARGAERAGASAHGYGLDD